MATKRPVFDHLTRWLITEVGLRDSYRVLEFITMWGIARSRMPGEMTPERFASFWQINRSTAFRHQSRFREAFGDRYPNPDPVCDALEAEFPKVFGQDDPAVAVDQLARRTL